MSLKLGNRYDASALVDVWISMNKEFYIVIYGEHINGYFCCIPSHGIGCEMAEPTDLFYNTRSLVSCGLDENTAKCISESIKQTIAAGEIVHSRRMIFEQSISTQGESYLTIYGENPTGCPGNFCCIPNHGIGCKMVRPADTVNNAQSLVSCGLDEEAAKSIAEAIQQTALAVEQTATESIDVSMQETAMLNGLSL